MVAINTVSTIGKIGAGLATAAILYDTNKHAKIRSAVYTEKQEAAALTRSYNEAKTLDAPSQVKADYKNFVRRLRWSNGARPFCNAIVGYFKGAGEMLTDHAVPAALATATLLLPKGLPSAISAGALAIYGGYDFLRTTFHVGGNKRYTK